jgi:uncharacterized protein YwqG
MWVVWSFLALFVFVVVILPNLSLFRRERRLEPATEEEIAMVRRQREAMAESALRLVTTEASGFCKLGGLPEAPAGLPWPKGRDGPLDFLLQVDLAACRAAGGPAWLPPAGAIYIFCDDNWGLADQARVIFAPPGDRATLTPPAEAKRYPERHLGLSARTSKPDFDWLDLDPSRFPEDMWTGDEPDEGPLHKLGGYPDQIQFEDMSAYADSAAAKFKSPGAPDHRPPAEAWRLLVQIDSDESVGMSWGDSGMIYILIREADARAGDFSRTVTTSQWY